MRRRTPLAILRLVLLSLLLGVVATLSTSLLFAYQSCAFQRTQWSNLLHRGDDIALATSDASLGKTIITWRSLQPFEKLQVEGSGTLPSENTTLGDHVPPAWSAYWEDDAFAKSVAAAGEYLKRRDDIAVGWPWRAFACSRFADPTTTPATTVVEGGRELASMFANRGLGHLHMEVRAIPLRPITSGLLLDFGVFTLIAFPLLLVARRLRTRSRRTAERIRSIPARAPPPARHAWASRIPFAFLLLLLGLLTTAVVAVALPLVVRQRTVILGSTTRPDTTLNSDVFWHEFVTLIPPEQGAALTPATAWELDQEIRGLDYTQISRKIAPSQQGRTQQPGQPMLRPLTCLRTGWPFSCLWGATWRASYSTPVTNLHLINVLAATEIPSVFRRGVRVLPTEPLWSGWVLDTLFYAALWLGVLLLFRRRRRRRRVLRGCCGYCGYDLHATPAREPCPECGSVRKLWSGPQTPGGHPSPSES